MYIQRVLSQSDHPDDQRDLKSKLRDNHRMCHELAVFTQQVLGYGPDYKECHENGCPCKNRDGGGNGVPILTRDTSDLTTQDGTEPPLCQTSLAQMMSADHPMTMVKIVRTDEVQSEDMLRAAEAELVVNVIKLYRQEYSHDDNDTKVFIVTPHHVQRKAVKRGLEALDLQNDVVVDTVERMQGGEVDLVIVCYAFMDLESTATEMDFIYTRTRINVALSRAKKKCIIITSDEVTVSNALFATAALTLASCECRCCLHPSMRRKQKIVR